MNQSIPGREELYGRLLACAAVAEDRTSGRKTRSGLTALNARSAFAAAPWSAFLRARQAVLPQALVLGGREGRAARRIQQRMEELCAALGSQGRTDRPLGHSKLFLQGFELEWTELQQKLTVAEQGKSK